MTMRSLMRKAARAAKAVKNGPEILEILTSDPAREAMKEASASGLPSVAGIGGMLLEDIDLEDLKHLPVRQYVGQVVRAVMDEEGYEIVESGVRFADTSKIFKSGSVYEEVDEDLTPDWVARVVGIMSDVEAEYAQRLLEERVPA